MTDLEILLVAFIGVLIGAGTLPYVGGEPRIPKAKVRR